MNVNQILLTELSYLFREETTSCRHIFNEYRGRGSLCTGVTKTDVNAMMNNRVYLVNLCWPVFLSCLPFLISHYRRATDEVGDVRPRTRLPWGFDDSDGR